MRRLKPCGTEAAYYRHKRAGEEPCQDCRQAQRAAWRRRARGESISFTEWGGLQPSGSLFRALDKLQVDGGWLTTDQLAHELDVDWRTMQRALYRLREKGLIEDRRVELTWEVGRVNERIEWRAVALPDYWGAAS